MAALVMIAFGPLPLQNIGRWQGPAKDTLAFYECRLGQDDNQRWQKYSKSTYCNQVGLNFLHSDTVGN